MDTKRISKRERACPKCEWIKGVLFLIYTILEVGVSTKYLFGKLFRENITWIRKNCSKNTLLSSIALIPLRQVDISQYVTYADNHFLFTFH